MARLPRIDLPGIPQHVVQRGNDRQPCFAREDDYRQYLQELAEAALKHDCALHTYVLMTNHVHLLVTPARPGALSRIMQAIGRRYVACFNARYRRTGTLWEGRFKSALVDSDRYALACYRYIELNPVRAGMVGVPGDYPWSSYHANCGRQPDARLAPHAAYLALGNTPDIRHRAYEALVAEGIPDTDTEALRRCTQQQKAWGSERFKREIEALLGRSVEVRTRGRPKAPPKK